MTLVYTKEAEIFKSKAKDADVESVSNWCFVSFQIQLTVDNQIEDAK